MFLFQQYSLLIVSFSFCIGGDAVLDNSVLDHEVDADGKWAIMWYILEVLWSSGLISWPHRKGCCFKALAIH